MLNLPIESNTLPRYPLWLSRSRADCGQQRLPDDLSAEHALSWPSFRFSLLHVRPRFIVKLKAFQRLCARQLPRFRFHQHSLETRLPQRWRRLSRQKSRASLACPSSPSQAGRALPLPLLEVHTMKLLSMRPPQGPNFTSLHKHRNDHNHHS